MQTSSSLQWRKRAIAQHLCGNLQVDISKTHDLRGGILRQRRCNPALNRLNLPASPASKSAILTPAIHREVHHAQTLQHHLPVHPEDHYAIDPMSRLDWEEIHALIGAKKFFVLHAPRQTGKTSTLLAMMDVLNQSGDYTTLYINVESAQAARGDVTAGMKTIIATLASDAEARLGDPRLLGWHDELWKLHGSQGAFKAMLTRWSRESPKPIVLMIDEVDALVGDTLISLLRQLREGYIGRPGIPFIQTAILCGVRDVRDYRIHTAHHEIITGGSAFNIKAESLRMGSFNQAEIATLYAQHTTETGQTFDPNIFPELWKTPVGNLG